MDFIVEPRTSNGVRNVGRNGCQFLIVPRISIPRKAVFQRLAPRIRVTNSNLGKGFWIRWFYSRRCGVLVFEILSHKLVYLVHRKTKTYIDKNCSAQSLPQSEMAAVEDIGETVDRCSSCEVFHHLPERWSVLLLEVALLVVSSYVLSWLTEDCMVLLLFDTAKLLWTIPPFCSSPCFVPFIDSTEMLVTQELYYPAVNYLCNRNFRLD